MVNFSEALTAVDMSVSTDSFSPMVGNFTRTVDLIRTYSPVTLSHDWPKVGRLLFMTFCFFFGTTMNIFFIASFYVEEKLRKVGNVFLGCAGFSDILITFGIAPVSAVVILSGQWDTNHVCRALQFLGTTSTYCYNINFAFVAIETFYRTVRPATEYAYFLSMRVDFMSVIICGISIALGAVGVYKDLDYDYCERSNNGDPNFRLYTMIFTQILPAMVTLILLVISCIRLKQSIRPQRQFRRSLRHKRDFSATLMNLVAYLIFLASWTPYLVVIHYLLTSSDDIYYNFVAIALCRASFTSTLYGIFNRNFRRAYGHIFIYCCCKNSITSSITRRRRQKVTQYATNQAEVRVHIMHQAMELQGASGVIETDL